MVHRFIPDRSVGELARQAERDIQAWKRVFFSHGASRDQVLSSLAGTLAKPMMYSAEATRRNLESSSSSVRLAAAYLVLDYWHSSHGFVPFCLQMAFYDPEPAVRGVALLSLRDCRRHIEDPTGALAALLRRVAPEENTAEAKEIASECRAELDELKSRIRSRQQDEWRKLAGDMLEVMLQSRETAESHLLRHKDPDVRRVAISLLETHFEPSHVAARACEALIFDEEADPMLRRAAVGFVAGYYKETDDPRIGRLLAGLVYADSQSVEVCQAAYHGLFELRGLPVFAWPDPSSLSQFPEGVDWSFVDSFLTTDN